MLKWPAMLMIGAATRDVGKTELACELIRQRAQAGPVYAVKITTIRETESGCPRGGAGCGVCGSLRKPFQLTEEIREGTTKDTARMRAAGAAVVFWLRVRQAHLAEGVRELRRHIPSDVPVVCESNGARSVLEPGIFLVLQRKGDPAIKESCREVIGHADRKVMFDGSDWSIRPEQIRFSGGRWGLYEHASAIILAGGQSRRMGRDKALLEFAGQPLLAHIADLLKMMFPEVLIGASDPAPYRFLGLDIVPDRESGYGPLMGIVSCLEHSRHDLNFVTACDIPILNAPFVRQMLDMADGYDAVMPVSPGGRHEPLFAVYHKTVIGPAREILQNGGRRIVDLLAHIKALTPEMPGVGWYRNLNTPEEYAQTVDDFRRSAIHSSSSEGSSYMRKESDIDPV